MFEEFTTSFEILASFKNWVTAFSALDFFVSFFIDEKKKLNKTLKIFPISLSFYNPFITFAVSSFKTYGGVGEWLKPPVC